MAASAGNQPSRKRRSAKRASHAPAPDKHVEQAVAVRYTDAAKAKVIAVLRELGSIRLVEPLRLAIVECGDSKQRKRALSLLKPLLDTNEIEFATTVLRDRESQLAQILTDEIAVRLKGKVSLKRLKSLEKKFGVKVARQNEFVPNQYILKVPQPSGLRTLEVAKRLDASKETEFATPNFVSEHRL
jgi:hypothetical protein